MTDRPDAPTVLDLFSGAGGMALGFAAAGFRLVAAVDTDPRCAETVETNFKQLQPDAPPLIETADLARLQFSKLANLHPDVIVGGPPCQGFSKIGRGKLDSLSDDGFASDPRNALYRVFATAIREMQPLAFVMENVPGMLSVEGTNVANEVATHLEGTGYKVGYALLNAVWFGVPQYRERLFFIGFREDLRLAPAAPVALCEMENPTGYMHRPDAGFEPSLPLLGSFRDHRLDVLPAEHPLPQVTVEQAIGDLPPIRDHLDDEPGSRSRFPGSRSYACVRPTQYAEKMRNWPGLHAPADLEDHEVRRTPRDYETFRLMKPGDRYPQAVELAWSRVDAEMTRRRDANRPVVRGSEEHAALVRAIVPPYGEAHERTEDAPWRTQFPDRWRKLIPGQPSWTVPAHLAKDSYSHIHYDNNQARMISVREAARLQSFPDGYSFAGNMGDRFRQIGNAVPPLVAAAVGRCVADKTESP